MKILVDMTLSPDWCAALEAHGHACAHWSRLGEPKATDRAVAAWAYRHEHTLLAHDLSFGAMIAATQGIGPSILGINAPDISPQAQSALVARCLEAFAEHLKSGALIELDVARSRARILRLNKDAQWMVRAPIYGR